MAQEVSCLGPPQANQFTAIASLKTLGQIGTPEALAVAATYATDERPFVRRALQAVRRSFDLEQFDHLVSPDLVRDQDLLTWDALSPHSSLPAYPTVCELELGDLSNLGPTNLAALRQVSDARSLSLHGTTITDTALTTLGRLGGIESLRLVDTRVTDAGLAALGMFSSLQSLSLWRTQVTNASLAVLGRLGDLQLLDLEKTKVTDIWLAALGRLSGLRWLNLEGTEVTDEFTKTVARQLR